MNCSACGTEIPFDERFCRNCGREAVPREPNVFVGSGAQSIPDPNKTEQFNDPLKTESINPPMQTARGWETPPSLSPPPSTATQSRKTLLVPLTVASIVIALVSLGALAYFMFSKDKVNGGAQPPERPQPTASPSVSTPSPSPTGQPTPTPTPTQSPSPTPTPTANNLPPPGARLGYCNDTNVFVRVAPDLNARPVTKITRGQKLWIIATSTNYSTWKGVNSNWTQVQLYNDSVRGWVFSPFISF